MTTRGDSPRVDARFGLGIERLGEVVRRFEQTRSDHRDVVAELFQVLVSRVGLPRHGPLDNRDNLRIDARYQVLDRHGTRREDPVQDARIDRSGKRHPVREELVRQSTDRVHVGAVIDGRSGELFGRHVVQRADDVAGPRNRPGTGAGDPEVENLHRARLEAHDVGRLDVAMHDAHRMGVVQAGADILEDRQLLPDADDALLPDELQQRLPQHVLHRDERTILVLADIEHRHDVGMLQPAGGSRFTSKALADGGIVEALLEQLDDDLPIDGRVTGEIHRAHAAVSDQPLDVIAPDDGWGHGHRPSDRRGGTQRRQLCECLVRTERMSKRAGDDPIVSILPTAGASAPFQYQRLRD